MANKLTEINPLSQLYDELTTILSGLVVKFSVKAEEFENLETRKYSDEYLDALQKLDKFSRYQYTDSDWKAAGILDTAAIEYYNNHLYLVPENIQEIMLANKRAKIISSYDEPNDYYRELNGCPPKNDVGAIIVTSTIKQSLMVVKDNDQELKNDYTSHRITESAAYHIMNTSMYVEGSYIAIFSTSIQNERTSSRSFFILPDEYPLDSEKSMRGVYLRDAKSIMYAIGMQIPPDDVLIGKYLFISTQSVIDTTSYFKNSFRVVEDGINDYDRNEMIKYSEAMLNNKNVVIDDFIVFKDFYYVTEYYEDLYGISTKVPIHKIGEYYGERFVSLLESTHYLDSLAEAHPDKPYLNFIGSKRVSILTARKARNFDILFMPPCEREVISWQFSVTYNGSRDYFVNTVYNPYYRQIYDYYDNFIGLCISTMAVAQTIAKSMETLIERDFYDETLVRWLFEKYDIPYISNLPYQTQRRLVKNLNMLIQKKATNEVIYDIASILGFHDITVYKYYLMKEREFDTDENLVYKDTTMIQPHITEDGRLVDDEVVVNDLERMYDIYFQKVDLKETNFHNALTDATNRVDYNDITMNDPLWWDDQETFDEVYGDNTKYDSESEKDAYFRHYNFMETKYLGITISYKMSEVLYENIILLRMIFDKKDELNDIFVTLPKLTGSLEVSVFDLVVFLCALTSKQHHLSGEILTKYSSILDVMGYINEDVDGYRPCDTLVFNFDKLTNTKTYNEIMKNPSRYLKPDEVDQFNSYMSVLVLDSATTKEKITAFNQMYQNIKGLGYFIGRKMSEAENIYEYRAWRDLYQALYIGEENNGMFELGESKETATTYAQYLSIMNPSLYSVLMETPDYELYSTIDHTISRLEKVVHNLHTLYLINDSNSSLLDYLITLVKFFKSYTTDLLNVETQFIFDARPDNLFKLAEWYGIKHVVLTKDAFKLMYSDAFKIVEYLKRQDPLKYKDIMYIGNKKILMNDILPINEMQCKNCPKSDCVKCGETRDNCDGTYGNDTERVQCHFFGYDTSSFYNYICTYRDVLMSIEYTDYADIHGAIRDHLSWIYKAYYLIDKYNPYTDGDASFEPSVLKDHMVETLNILNSYMTKHGANVTITEEGLKGIYTWIDLLMVTGSNIPKVCKNPHYPCIDSDCKCKDKEYVGYLETIHHNDSLGLDEYMEFYISKYLEEYRIFTRDEIANMAETMNTFDTSTLFMNDYAGIYTKKKMIDESIYEFFDTMMPLTHEVVADDKMILRDDIIFIPAE